MKPAVTSLAAVLLCVASAAHADQVIRAGEWQVTDVVNGKPSVGPMKICQSSDRTVEEIFTRTLAKPGTSCTKKTFQSNGDIVTFELICTISGIQVTMRGTHTWTGADTYHVDYHTHYDAPGMSDIARTGDAEWLGPCQLGDVMQKN